MGDEVKRYIELAGEQAPAFDLGTEPVRNEVVQKTTGFHPPRLGQFLPPSSHALGQKMRRVELYLDRYGEVAAPGVDSHVDLGHLSHRDTAQVHRCADGEAADGLLEHQHELLGRCGVLERLVPGSVERKGGVGRGRR